ncbi:MAG TPA: hypothetical protein VNU68_15650 [Verrucomicrobiae bacterium]|nr:hypothetical protein [Verrucomicrobiae bacterium]
MTDLLLKLLNVPAADVVRVTGASLELRGGLTMGWYVFLVLLAAAAIVWLYKVSPVTLAPWRKRVLTVLRVIFLAMMLALLLRPVLAFTVEGSVRRVLVLLLDGSASMQIKDPRLEAPDQKRAALARNLLDPRNGLNQPLERTHLREVEQVSRLDLAKAVLKNERLNLLPRLDKEFDLAAFSFGRGLSELSARGTKAATNSTSDSASPSEGGPNRFDWVDRLEATAPTTAIGDAVREVMNRKRGQPLAGVVLFTDGVNNSGSQPREAAALAAQERVPLFIYGVGITSPRDIIVQNLFAQEVSFVRDEVPVTVRVRGQGLAGQTAEVQLKLNDQVVARREITFGADAEQVVALKFTPQTLGEFDLVASVEPRPDETVKDNNSRSQRLKVIDAKIKVLLADQSPRWEFRYLQAMFLRDRRVELKCYLVEGDKAISRVPDSPYLPEFPSRRDDLFRYDLVILGDLDPKVLTTQHQENLNKLVSDFGGAVVILAGKRFMPATYRRTVLDKLLPVEFDPPTLESAQDPVADKPVKLQLTAAGRASIMLRLSDKEEENAQLWSQLPPLYWVAKVSRPKPAAEVLLVDPDPARESRFGKMPVMAAQQYGLGQVLFIGSDNFWRWRKNAGDFYHTAIWGQIAQRVSMQRLLGVSRRTQLSSDRQNYFTGDRIGIYARLYSGAGFDPVQEPAIKGFFGLKSDGGPRAEVILRPVPEQPAMYRGEFVAPAAGAYAFQIESDPATQLDFNVTEPKFEFGETAMNEPLLKDLASLTGGQFFREEDLHKLPDAISAKTERVRSPLEAELWASPLYFLIMLGVVTLEWLLRKWSHLK